MKKLIITTIITLLALPLYLQAAETEITLAWDANTPNPYGYQVFCREEGQNYDYTDPVWEGDHTFTMCSLSDLDDTKQYFFVTRAVDIEGNQSGDSNEVGFPDSGADDDGGSERSLDGGGSADSIAGSSCFIQSLLSY